MTPMIRATAAPLIAPVSRAVCDFTHELSVPAIYLSLLTTG